MKIILYEASNKQLEKQVTFTIQKHRLSQPFSSFVQFDVKFHENPTHKTLNMKF